MFHCHACRRISHERTGTPFNHLQVPTDLAVLMVLWRLQYKLSLRNGAEIFLTRGFTVSYKTVRAWEERLAPLLTAWLKARRRGKAGRTWLSWLVTSSVLESYGQHPWTQGLCSL